MLPQGPGFHVFRRGPHTVIGFDGRILKNPALAAESRDELLDLIDDGECQWLVVDLMEVDIVSSWILGVLAAIRRRGVDVQLYHASPEIRNVLEVTHLDRMLPVRHAAGVRPAPAGLA